VLRIKAPNMERPYKIPGGWPVIFLVVLFPAAIIVVAVWDQAMCAGVMSTIGLSALALASGPILYPIARHFRGKRVRSGELTEEGVGREISLTGTGGDDAQ